MISVRKFFQWTKARSFNVLWLKEIQPKAEFGEILISPFIRSYASCEVAFDYLMILPGGTSSSGCKRIGFPFTSTARTMP